MASDIQPFTPARLIELFNQLPPQNQAAFLRLLGGQLAAEGAFAISLELPLTERARYTDMVAEELLAPQGIFTELCLRAIQFARTAPPEIDEALAAELLHQTNAAQGVHNAAFEEVLLARTKEHRDRGRDPETIRRNLEICTLRHQDRRKWSIKKLASKFAVDVRSIKRILKDEPLWRRQGTKTGHN